MKQEKECNNDINEVEINVPSDQLNAATYNKLDSSLPDDANVTIVEPNTNESIDSSGVVEYEQDYESEKPFEVDGVKWKYVWAIYPDGKRDIGVYRFDQDVVYSLDWFKDNVIDGLVNRKPVKESVKLKKGLLLEMISTALMDRLENGNHSLKNNPSLPTFMDENYILDLANSSYDKICKRLKSAHGVDEIDMTDMLGDYSEDLDYIKTVESQYKDELLDLAKKIIVDEFYLDENDIDFDLDLVEDVYEMDKMDFSSDIKFNNADEIELINNEIHKRRIINALIQGGGRRVADLIEKNRDLINELNPKLCKKYCDVSLFADLMYFIKNDPMLNASKSGSLNIVMMGDKPKIIARAVNFPALLMEIGKGVFEVLTYHSLPTNEQIMGYVINKADKDEFETDDIRLGIPLYDKLCSLVPDGDKRIKYLLINKLSKIEVPEFHSVIRNILADTKEGDNYLDRLITGVKKELIDYDNERYDYNSSFFTLDELDDIDFDF